MPEVAPVVIMGITWVVVGIVLSVAMGRRDHCPFGVPVLVVGAGRVAANSAP